MILNKEEIEKRVNSEKNLVNQIAERQKSINEGGAAYEVVIKDGKNHSGNKGSSRLTDEERVAVGVLARLDGAKTAAEVMGISPHTAKHIMMGHKNTEAGPDHYRKQEVDEEFKKKVLSKFENTKLTIAERAAEKLLGALDVITPEKLENASVKDVATISNNMAQVIRNISGTGREREGDGGAAKVKIVLHAPDQARESAFDFIEISSK